MILSKEKLKDWLDALKEHTLIAPTENDETVTFRLIDNQDDIVLDKYSVFSPKGVILPQTEKMFTFVTTGNVNIDPPADDDGKRIVFGIRPCDAKSFSILDHVFEGEYKDEYYLKKRENTTLIGLACHSPKDNCFCTSLDCGPGSKDDVDILLTDLGDSYYVDVVTDKGKALVEESSSLFTSPTEEDTKKKDQIHSQAEGKIQRSVNVDGIQEKLGAMFDSDYWKKVSDRCLRCGICTYLCPTCHCFDMQDEKHGTKGRRARMWDSCMYPEYTVHTSGHNPRPTRMNRLRNRVYHKFKYYPDNFDVFLCVGCGRCVDNCPVNIDIIEIVNDVSEGGS